MNLFKSKEKDVEKNSTVKKEDKLPVAMGNAMMADAENASGFDNVTADDIAIPFMAILQALSPQVRGDNKIDGAAEGYFFNTVTSELFKEPIDLIPCAFIKVWIEWKTRESGGGLVAIHEDSLVLDECRKNEKGQDIRKNNGNQIATTAQHYCIQVKEDGSLVRVVISLNSTQLKKSRKWMSQMQALRITGPGKDAKPFLPPMFSHVYIAKSVFEKNDKGEWMGWEFGHPALINDAKLYKFAKKFSDDVLKGKVKAAPPSQEEGDQTPTEKENAVL